jgi:hypothetical protein
VSQLTRTCAVSSVRRNAQWGGSVGREEEEGLNADGLDVEGVQVKRSRTGLATSSARDRNLHLQSINVFGRSPFQHMHGVSRLNEPVGKWVAG